MLNLDQVFYAFMVLQRAFAAYANGDKWFYAEMENNRFSSPNR